MGWWEGGGYPGGGRLVRGSLRRRSGRRQAARGCGLGERLAGRDAATRAAAAARGRPRRSSSRVRCPSLRLCLAPPRATHTSRSRVLSLSPGPPRPSLSFSTAIPRGKAGGGRGAAKRACASLMMAARHDTLLAPRAGPARAAEAFPWLGRPRSSLPRPLLCPHVARWSRSLAWEAPRSSPPRLVLCPLVARWSQHSAAGCEPLEAQNGLHCLWRCPMYLPR